MDGYQERPRTNDQKERGLVKNDECTTAFEFSLLDSVKDINTLEEACLTIACSCCGLDRTVDDALLEHKPSITRALGNDQGHSPRE